ncbi:hypothetical protein BOA8489_01064 [Boseongicola aestuarii]|uniref:Uncharacterized protein n=2 Tax=Boseongicola aestuarii TaxID=1470561 RepID=A0A238IYL7_9RHOB|nr:hypothetical protein BOA8489_01064 [Boseongicola aestuarii]
MTETGLLGRALSLQETNSKGIWRNMKDFGLVASILVRILVAFIGCTHLFAQLFFADFNPMATAVGLGAFAVAGLTGLPVKRSAFLTRIGIYGGCIALLGTAGGIYVHYAYYDTPGNYYAWFITVPFAAGSVFLMVAAWRGHTLR